MPEITKVQRQRAKARLPLPPTSELDDAVSWLTQHIGFPARSRAELEAKRGKRSGQRS